MKILIIQEKGRHSKNQLFREALNLNRAFKLIGVNSSVWGLNYENFKFFDKIIDDFDVIILLENYETNNWVPDLSKYNKLKIFWSIDSHCVLSNHVSMCKKHKIDLVLNAIESHGKKFPCKSYYFPNAYPDDLIYPIDRINKVYNVGFCGNMGTKLRTDTINRLKKDKNLKLQVMAIGDDMVNAINSYKIHFNMNIADDINYRTFETLGCKTLLLTNRTENLDKHFKVCDKIGGDGELVVYNDYNDCLKKIDWLLSDPQKSTKIAESGYCKVRGKHTFVNRAKTLLDIINSNKK